MLFGLSGAGATAHTDVLDCSAETGHLMTFEVGQADEDIGIHDSASDLCRFYILTADNRNINVIGSL